MATATEPTVGTIGTTPVLFFPVPTPWPMSARCDKHIHRQNNQGSILAWDPVYPQLASRATVERGESCYPTQQQSWHFQASTATPSTALGPTFVCPEQYTAVFSTLVESNSASRTDYTYCCPPKYTLNALLPQNQRSAVQCTSILPIGSTLSFLSVTFTPTTLSPGTTTNVIAYLPSSTVVTGAPETVFGVPVNGYNIVPALRQLDSSTIATATAAPTTGGTLLPGLSPAPPNKTPAGTIAGAAVGGVAALALGVAVAYFVGRRRRRGMAAAGAGAPVEVAGAGAGQEQGYYAYGAQHQQRPAVVDEKFSPYSYGVTPVSEYAVPPPVVRHELPSQSQRFELPGGAAEGAGYHHGGGGYSRSGAGGV